MTDNTSMQNLWHRCAEIITKLEQRYESDALPCWDSSLPLFSEEAEDLLRDLPSIKYARIWFVDPKSTRCLGDAGDSGGEGENICCEKLVIPGELVRVEVIWNAKEFATDNRNDARQAIREFSESVTAVLVGAVSRSRLQASVIEITNASATIQRLQSSKSVMDACHRIAEDIATAMQLERCSLLIRRGQNFSLLGSSVQPNVDLRSQKAIALQHLATAMAPRLHSTNTNQHPRGGDETSINSPRSLVVARDETDAGIGEAMDRAEVCQIVAISFAEGQAIVIGEFADQRNDIQHNSDQLSEVSQTQSNKPSSPRNVSDIGMAAFESVITQLCQRIPSGRLTRLSDWLGLSKNRNRLIAIAVIAALLWIVPMRIKVAANGQVVPVEQHVVYAPVTGRLEKILCLPGQRVKAGDSLCLFSSHEIELKLTQLQGEIFTVKEKIEIASTRRGDDSVKGVASDRRVLETQLKSLEEQLHVLNERKRELSITSPVDGLVSLIRPDDFGPATSARPVAIGQGILRVVNPKAGYTIRANVRDREIGYVLEALNRSDRKSLHCQFRIRSDSVVMRQGIVAGVDPSAKLDRHGNLVVPVDIMPNDNQELGSNVDLKTDGDGRTPQPVPIRGGEQFSVDSDARIWILCERASSGFVLFRGVIEQVRLWGWL